MTRQAYGETLRQVAMQNSWLSIDAVDLARLSPHLDEPDALRSHLIKGAAVALPSLWVKNAYWSVRLTSQQLLLVMACRTRASYKGEGAHNRQPTPGPTPLFVSEALDYANRHWPKVLKDDMSLSAAVFTLCDPARLRVSVDGLDCSAVFRVDISRLPFENTPGFSKLLNGYILEATERPTKQEEWLGDGSTRFFYCLRCGQSLLPTHCSGCRLHYGQPQQFPAIEFPMPQRIRGVWRSAGIRFNA